MYIIAVIKNNVCYWSYPKLYMDKESAKVMLKKLKERGGQNIEIYEIMNLEKVNL